MLCWKIWHVLPGSELATLVERGVFSFFFMLHLCGYRLMSTEEKEEEEGKNKTRNQRLKKKSYDVLLRLILSTKLENKPMKFSLGFFLFLQHPEMSFFAVDLTGCCVFFFVLCHLSDKD